MPASRRTSETLRHDDQGVSEVVGQILMFGILSMVLILSMLSFNIAKESTEERVIATSAESIAQRVASLVIETALFGEKFGEQDVSLESRLNLPQRIEGREYSIELDGSQIIVVAAGATVNQPLFAAGSEGLVHVCKQAPLDGGPIIIRITAEPPAAGFQNLPPACVVAPATEPQFYVTLENA